MRSSKDDFPFNLLAIPDYRDELAGTHGWFLKTYDALCNVEWTLGDETLDDTWRYPPRQPSTAMLAAATAFWRNREQSAESADWIGYLAIYDATSRYALHLCANDTRIDATGWLGPAFVDDTIKSILTLYGEPHVLCWWDGERLHEVPRKSRPKLAVVRN